MEHTAFVANNAAPLHWESPERSPLETIAPPQQAEQTAEAGLVYFHTTESVEKALLTTAKWSWVIVSGFMLLALIELLALFNLLVVVQQTKALEKLSVTLFINEVFYLSVAGLLIRHGILFGVKIRQAIKQRDNWALAQGFYHQSQFFFWAFMHLLLPVVKPLLEGIGAFF